MLMKLIALISFLGTFILPISAWMTQKVPFRSFSKTRHYGLLPRRQFKKELIVPGITIPIDGFSEVVKIAVTNDYGEELQIGKFVASAGGTVAGKQKSDPTALNELQNKYLSAVVTNRADLPANYQYFGNANNAEILKQLLLHNPFFTSALQANGGGFAISSYAKNENPTRYSKLITAYAAFPRVNVKLNSNLAITSYSIYDINGNDITSGYTQDQAIKFLLFTLMYYAEVVHAAIHIYNLINVIGILTSSEDSKDLIYPWAESYLLNVGLKYFEVEHLLLNQGGALVGGGFLGTRDQVLQYTTEVLLKPWLKYSTFNDLVEDFVFPTIPKAQRNGFLPEYFNQANLIPQFATDLTTAIKNADAKAYSKLNTKLAKYYKDLGSGVSTYQDVSTWIQIQSAFGIFHGGTLSFSRYIATPSCLPLLDLANTGAYTKQDEKIAITVLATTDGLTSDRYVYSSNLLKSQSVITNVLKTYNTKTNDIKTQYFNSIKNDPNFPNYGWIWSDFGPNLIDNKQLTLTTYV